MNNFMFDNYEYFVMIKPKKIYWFYILLLIMIVLSIYSFTIKTSDVYETKSYYECNDECKLFIQAPLIKVNDFTKADNIMVDKKIISIDNYQVGDIKTDSNKENYQLITYTISKQDIINKTYNDVRIFYNEEIMFNKIIKYFIK